MSLTYIVIELKNSQGLQLWADKKSQDGKFLETPLIRHNLEKYIYTNKNII